MTTLSPAQLDILCHMLGITDPYTRCPVPYRDYYCACPGDPDMKALDDARMVYLYSTHGGYDWFTTTDAGKAAARARHRAIRKPAAARRYHSFLGMRDVLPDLTFREFLKSPDFAVARRIA